MASASASSATSSSTRSPSCACSSRCRRWSSSPARATADAIDAIRPLAGSIEAAARRADLIAYIEADRRFHLALLSLAGNRQLVDVVDRLRAKARLYGIRELAARGLLIRSAEEHAAILDHLVAHDVEGTERLMRRHLGHVRGAWAGRAEDDG